MEILIVDDKIENIVLLENILRSLDYQVLVASNGKLALQKLADRKVDLIISDILMPEMDGFQLCRKVKASKDLWQIPFIFYTATYTDAKDEELALKEGADHFICKPIEPAEFTELIKKLVKQVEDKKIVAKKLELSFEEETLNLYNARLVKKLEQKTINLEKEIELHRESERALQISEERYRALFNASEDALFVRYLPGKDVTKSFLEVNDIACRRLGYSREEMLNMTPEDVLAPESIEPFRQAMEVLQNKKKVVFEVKRLTKDGRRIPVEINSSLFYLDGKDTVLSVSRDISRRKEAEKEINMLAHTIKSINESVCVTDLQERILFANDALLETYGYSWAELSGKEAKIFRSEKTPAEIEEQILPQTLKGGWQGEVWNKRKNGDEFQIHLSTSIIYNETGNPEALVGISSDISEQKNIEEQFYQAQKMESMGQLAAGVAHDFNNLLTVINGYSGLLMDEVQSDDSHSEMVQQIQEAGDRAKNLIVQLLAFSRKQVILPKIVNMNDLILNAEKMLGRIIEENIEMELKLSSLNLSINIDPGQMDQILMNLVVNARDAMPDGGKIILETSFLNFDGGYLAEHLVAKKGRYALLSIHDNGVGMDEETRSRIFEPFFTTKIEGEGTGLGLATVFGIVQQNDGYLWVESEPGQGSTFKIAFPILKIAEIEDNNEETEKRLPGGNETILLLEDDDAVRNFVIRLLTDYGYRVHAASLPEEALDIFDKQQDEIDLIITDVIMPQMNGKDFFDRVSAKKPGLKALYISGYPMDVLSSRGVLHAGIHMLQKPLVTSDLLKSLRQILTQ
ncbi:MAG: response regulator [SAR324 cluster bacterium]|nr:response regulator [SAR324 cluster bacterium]